jgi:hypothetical protein
MRWCCILLYDMRQLVREQLASSGRGRCIGVRIENDISTERKRVRFDALSQLGRSAAAVNPNLR